MSGSYRGTAVPPVGGISYHGYTAPANWQDPAVSGQDLMVQRDALRQVASQISALAGELEGIITAWQALASGAATTGAVGAWPEAQQLAAVIGRSHSGFGEYSGDLRQAHHDTATRITVSADRYDSTEQANVSLANASHDPSAIIVESGGSNVPVDPGYGKNWSAQQREAYARTQRLIAIDGGDEVWTGTYPISSAAGFQQAGTAGYTWQQVQSLLGNTDPGAISAAGSAYGQLAGKLTQVAGKVAGLGHALAGSWGGSTAVTAVSQVQQLYQTAADMQANAWQAQQALTWYGSVLNAFKDNLPQPASTHPSDVAAANQAAQQRMSALNGHIQSAYYAMPGAVNKNLPPKLAGAGGGAPSSSAASADGSGPIGGSPGGGGMGGGPGNAGAPGGASSVGGLPPPGSVSPAGSVPPPGGVAPPPVGVPPPESQVSGAGGPPPGSPGGPGSPGNPGGPAPGDPVPGGPVPGGPGGVMPPVPGGGAPGGEGTPPGSGGASPGGAPGGEGAPPGGGRPGALPGEDPAPAGAGIRPGEPAGVTPGVPPGGAAAGEPGMTGEPGGMGTPGEAGPGSAAEGGMLPMGGSPGGGAAGGIGRARQAWTTEDDGTWRPEGGLSAAGEPGDGLFMPVGPGGGQERERDRSRMAWLAEDDDLWGAEEPAVPPVIGRLPPARPAAG
jgi:hypothetical protein